MGTSALGGLATGIMQGQSHMDTRRRNKAVDNLLERDAYEKDLEYSARKDDFLKVDGNTEEMWEDFNNPEEVDPYAVRGFNWLKQKFGFGSKTDDVMGVEPYPGAEPKRTAVPNMKMADGGRVYTDEERMKRSYGDYYVTDEEAAANRDARTRGERSNGNYQASGYKPGVDRQALLASTSGGGPRAAIDDLKRSASESNTAQAYRNYGTNMSEAVGNVADQDSPEGTGKATRQALQTHGQGLLNVTGGIASDVSEGLGLGKAAGFLRGFVGKDGTRDNRQPDPGTPAPVTEGKQAPTQAIETSLGKGESDQAMAGKAVDAAVEMTPGHPDNPDQTFDASEIAASGVRPEDIPNATVSDWARYRRLTASAAAKRGQSVEKAMEDVTKMQMQGFSSNAQQASFLLNQGDARGAAIAMRMAYQYFPNGSDVRFGIAEGVNGPVLVGMGVDEKTGESVQQEGKPMVLTPEVISVYVNQMSDPSAFRTWTKDWRDQAADDRKYEEVEKPTAQGRLNLMGAQTRAADASAAKDRAYVNNPRSQGGGLKQADLDRAGGVFVERLGMESIEDPRLADQLASGMTSLYKQFGPQVQPNEIANIVMGVHNGEYTLAEALAQYGINIGAEQP